MRGTSRSCHRPDGTVGSRKPIERECGSDVHDGIDLRSIRRRYPDLENGHCVDGREDGAVVLADR